MKKIILFLWIIFNIPKIHGQEITTDKATIEFIFCVKSIDEFIGRFNNAEHTEAFKYWLAQTGKKAKREENILSILSAALLSKQQDINEAFIEAIVSQKKYLNFYDAEWFVELNAYFMYENKKVVIPLILQSQGSLEEGSKWLIMSVNAPFLNSDCEDIAAAKEKTILNPTSHGINFMNLRQAFNDKENLNNYFADFDGDNLIAFKKNILSGKLKFEYITDIKYHFLQIPDWCFVVELFESKETKPSIHGGWLISKIAKMSISAKNDYKQNVLNFYH